MVSIIYIFWMYVFLFAFIGAMRGWAKELLVSFSMVLALTINYMLRRYVPIISEWPIDEISLFWIRTIIVTALVYFGYQTVASVDRFKGKARKEKLQDALFGGVLGGLNGYLVTGTVWAYLQEAQYPFPKIFYDQPPEVAAEVARMMEKMPPYALGEPGIYFALVLVLIFILVVYI